MPNHSGDYNHINGRPYTAHASQPKPKIDAKFIADPELWDPATPRDEKVGRRRAQSAKGRPKSGHMR